jgi:hypothetical protein
MSTLEFLRNKTALYFGRVDPALIQALTKVLTFDHYLLAHFVETAA